MDDKIGGTTQILPDVPGILLVSASLGLLSVPFLLVFPFYLLIYLENREKDKKLPTYPIISHFFKTICFFYVVAPILCVTFLLGYLGNVSSIGSILSLMFSFTIAFLFIFVQVQHVLVCFLSIQRFLLYFLPDKENILEMGQKGMGRLIKILYPVVFLFNIITLVLYLCFLSIYEDDEVLGKIYMV
uniref:DUF996 domain-containing protein n=1 Tax=Caenorhabditis tropicalis TaxID=1561998 RepID=A0A1I7TUR5_9PELO